MTRCLTRNSVHSHISFAAMYKQAKAVAHGKPLDAGEDSAAKPLTKLRPAFSFDMPGGHAPSAIAVHTAPRHQNVAARGQPASQPEKSRR